MLFARWQHHIRFGSGFPYAPLKAMLTKILKWSRIQDSFRIAPKIESFVVYAMPDIPSKFQKDPSITFWVILLTHRQIDRQTNKLWQKHNLLGGGNKINALLIKLILFVCFSFLFLFCYTIVRRLKTAYNYVAKISLNKKYQLCFCENHWGDKKSNQLGCNQPAAGTGLKLIHYLLACRRCRTFSLWTYSP